MKVPALIVAVAGCLALSALAACGSDGEGRSGSGNAEADRPHPPPPSEPAPSGPCARAHVESSVQEFLAAANSGRAARIEDAVAGRGLIFSHGLEYGRQRPRRFFSTADREELVRHLLKRRARGDRMDLLSIGVTGFDRSLGVCNFWFEISRRIGGGPLRTFGGKGAINQESGGVVVWNTGGGEPL